MSSRGHKSYSRDLSFSSFESTPNGIWTAYLPAFVLGTLSIKSIVPSVPSSELRGELFYQAQNALNSRWDSVEFQDILVLGPMALYAVIYALRHTEMI